MIFETMLAISLGLIFIILSLIFYARWKYGILDNLGFPVMQPSFILGSDPKLHKKVQHYEDINRFQQFGPVWGYYQGRRPIIFIADVDLIRQIFVKDTPNFYNREPMNLGHDVLSEILDFQPGEKWKTLRISQTKLFSSGKIKSYVNQIFIDSMDKVNANLFRELEGNDQITVDIREQFCVYTIDITAKSLMSFNVDPVKDSIFYNACKKLIGDGQKIDGFYIWTLAFPFLSSFQPTMVLDPGMINRFNDLITSRLKSGIIYGDYGDVMVDTVKKLTTPQFKSLAITKKTVMGQAVNLFLAGFDRISSLLSFLMYHLAKDPDIQDRLYQEIQDALQSGTINYDTLKNLEYLDACIMEISRLYPILLRPERVCGLDWTDPKSQIRIPKGVSVAIASWAVNRNPLLWENPDEFNPERFLPSNRENINNYAYTTFGFGHRNCIGMRFAYEAMRVAIASILINFQIQLHSNTQLKFKTGINFIIQFEPILLNFSTRSVT